jgi:glucose uptake protein GlcU
MKMTLIKRSLALTIISVVVSFIAFLIITRHSNIRAVEVLVILALGMGLSALIFNLAQLYSLKKECEFYN